MYDLTHSSPDLSGLAIDELDTITIQVENNGYIYAGGIWQADWSNDQGQYVFNCICACSIDLVNVTRLLSPEEMELVEQAIAHAKAFLKERFLSTILLNCREMDEQAPEASLQLSAEPGDARSENHRWQMLWNGFMPAPRTLCHLSVSYRPQIPEAPFLVELIQEYQP